jgi:hypothetical protein
LNLFKDSFRNIGELTLSHIFDKVAILNYVTKTEGRISGPYVAGTKEKFDLKYSTAMLKDWQQDLFNFILKAKENKNFRDRKIIWVQDCQGNTGKSFFQKWLILGQRQVTVKRLPIAKTSQLISDVTKVVGDGDVDLFTINLTRTQGEDHSFREYEYLELSKYEGAIESYIYWKSRTLFVLLMEKFVNRIISGEEFEDSFFELRQRLIYEYDDFLKELGSEKLKDFQLDPRILRFFR